MFNRVLLPIDGTDSACRAAAFGASMTAGERAQWLGIEVLRPLPAVAMAGDFIVHDRKGHAQCAVGRAHEHLAKLAAMTRTSAHPFERGVVFDRRPYAAIAATATLTHCDLIVVGASAYARGHQVRLSREVSRLLGSADVPVLIWPSSAMEAPPTEAQAMFRHILLATDGSIHSDKSVAIGVGLARDLGAKVLGFHVAAPFSNLSYLVELLGTQQLAYETEAAERAERYLDDVRHEAQVAGVECECEYRFAAHPHQAIVELARDRGCDLIVMGSRGRQGVERLLLGSVTHRVLLLAETPVLVCP